MEKGRRRIGVFISQCESTYQGSLLEGILSQAFALNYDVLIFSTFIKDGTTVTWQAGEQNIFNLPNYDLIDGILFVPDTIKIPGLAETLERRLRQEFQKPVVLVDLKSSHFPSVLTDDAQIISDMIEHLINEHGMKDIAFMTGIAGHPHAENRLKGYRAAMKKHRLPVGRHRVFYGDFWYEKGASVVGTLLTCGKPLPQAIACASDPMAISVCDALIERGYRVPEDILVTGYDVQKAGMEHSPSITSARLPAKQTGYNAVALLHSLITGTDYTEAPSESTLYLTESCGCPQRVRALFYDKNSYTDSNYINPFFSNNNFMLEDLLSISTLNDCLNQLSWYGYQLEGIQDFYLCLCENWNNLGALNPDSYLREGYTQYMTLALYRSSRSEGDSKIGLENRFPVEELLPAIYESRDYPTAFYFTPLHFNDRCFGYTVINYGTLPVAYDIGYRSWMRNVNNAFEALRIRSELHYLYQMSEENSIKDPLSTIFNRAGFSRYSDRLLREAHNTRKKLLIIIGDMNNLKLINDNWGHVEGDSALRTVGRAFASACTSAEEFCFRIGGDEFVTLSIQNYTFEAISMHVQRIIDYLEQYNHTSQKPYLISISLGYSYMPVSNGDTIERHIAVADERMLRNKREIKQSDSYTLHNPNY